MKRSVHKQHRRRIPWLMRRGHWGIAVVQLTCCVTVIALAFTRVEPPLPPTPTGLLRTALLTFSAGCLALLPSLLFTLSSRLLQVVYGTGIVFGCSWWCYSVAPTSQSQSTYVCMTAAISCLLLLASAAQLPLGKPRRVLPILVATTTIIGTSAVVYLLPPVTHPGDYSYLELFPGAQKTIPWKPTEPNQVRVTYPPKTEYMRADLSPHIVFVLTDSMSGEEAKELVQSLPTSCRVLENHYGSEDILDGIFSLAYSLDPHNRFPFEQSGQQPVAFQLLDYAGYDRQVVAVRNMYPKKTLDLWGQVQLTDTRQFNTAIQKRLASRERRPLFLTVFPGNHRHTTRVVDLLADYARVDTVLILTGLAGPRGRTAAVSCAPVPWNASRTHHVQIIPKLLKMMGLKTGNWHVPLSDPVVVTSANFPFSESHITIYEDRKGRRIRTCTDGYFCFHPEEPALSTRLTRFLAYP